MADTKEHGPRERSRPKALVGAAYGDLLRWRRQLELLASVFGRDTKQLCRAALARLLAAKPSGPALRASAGAEDGTVAAEPSCPPPSCPLHEELRHELMNVYHEADAAVLLVRRIGFPRPMMPAFTTPDAYWSKVVTALRDGAVASGLEALALAAGRQYPANPVFARIVEQSRATHPDEQQARVLPSQRVLFASAREVIASVQAWPGRRSSLAISTAPRHIEIIQRVRRHFMQLDDASAVRLIDVLLARATCEEARIQLGLEQTEIMQIVRRVRREVEHHGKRNQRR